MKPGRQPLLSSDRSGAQEALAELRDTSDQEVSAATIRAAGISEEDERGLTRQRRSEEDRAWGDMRVTCVKALPWIIIPGLVIVAVGVLALVGIWLFEQASDPAKLDALIRTAIAGAGGSALTFLGQHVFRNKLDGR